MLDRIHLDFDKLATALRDRGITEAVHFHTDHFEPTGQIGISQVEAFLRLCEGGDSAYARRPSLFHLSTALNQDGEFRVNESSIDEDVDILKFLAAHNVDTHVHIHHEAWTSGYHSGMSIDADRDAKRLDTYLSLLLPYMRQYVSVPEQWGFIHGCWALNASDPNICYISDEIRILAKHGCVGDFSFPAGRSYCDPSTKVPFDIIPVNRPRSYDSAVADPKVIVEKMRPGHFLIWNAASGFQALSVENIAIGNLSPGRVLTSWLTSCPVIAGRLYVKTFCHSMNSMFWDNRGGVPPFFSDNMKIIFDGLSRVCEIGGVRLRYATASEVISELR